MLVVLGALATSIVAWLPSSAATITPNAVPDDRSAATVASMWLEGQASGGVLAGFGGPDWALMADAAYGHVAAGRGAAAAPLADAMADGADDYIAAAGPGTVVAGSVAKSLVVWAVLGRDPSDFGGWNLRATLLSAMTTTPGANLGRFQNVNRSDTSNVYVQGYAVLGLARTGGVPAEAVAFLRSQQCPAGGFRIFVSPGATCTNDVQGDVDATAMAIQALDASHAAGSGDPAAVAAADAGRAWLTAQQKADGSFGGSGPTSAANANSTGLALQVLRADGRHAEADRAAAWLRSLQLGCGTPDAGAVAYDPTAFAAAVNGVVPSNLDDQYRRTTAQAILGFAGVSFAELSVADVPPAPSAICTSTTTTSGPTTTAGATTSTTTSAPTSTTAATSTTTSTTTSSTLPTSTTTSPTEVATATARRGATAVSSAGEGAASAGGSAPSSLAATGRGVASVVATAAWCTAAGVALLTLRRRRR